MSSDLLQHAVSPQTCSMNPHPFDLHTSQGHGSHASLALCRVAGAAKFKKQPLI
jgi:hypothetical protein